MLVCQSSAKLGNDTKLKQMRTALMPLLLLLFTHLYVGVAYCHKLYKFANAVKGNLWVKSYLRNKFSIVR